MTVRKYGLAVLLVIFIIVAAFPVRDILIDDPLSGVINEIIQSYRYPERIEHNGYIDFIALERPEGQSLNEFKNHMYRWRTSYDIYQPEKMLAEYSANNSQKFYGVAWLFNCWLTFTPSDGACIQPHVFERLALKKNALILDRYEQALTRRAFYADPLVDLSDEFVGAAVAYMASVSFYADSGDWDTAIKRWSNQHTALFRFINEGHHSLQSFFRLTQLYHFSLKTAERMVYNGLPPNHWKTLEKNLSAPFDTTGYEKHALSQEIGFYNDQLLRYYRPIFHGFNFSRIANYKNPVPIQRLFNGLKLGNRQKIGDDTSANTKTPAGVVSTLSTYIADHENGVRSLIYLNAQQTALSLGLSLAHADIAENNYQQWLDNRPERNPFSNNSYRYNIGSRCLSFMDDNKQSTCISMPTFIPQTPVPVD